MIALGCAGLVPVYFRTGPIQVRFGESSFGRDFALRFRDWYTVQVAPASSILAGDAGLTVRRPADPEASSGKAIPQHLKRYQAPKDLDSSEGGQHVQNR